MMIMVSTLREHPMVKVVGRGGFSLIPLTKKMTSGML